MKTKSKVPDCPSSINLSSVSMAGAISILIFLLHSSVQKIFPPSKNSLDTSQAIISPSSGKASATLHALYPVNVPTSMHLWTAIVALNAFVP